MKTHLSIRYATHPPCSIPAPFNISVKHACDWFQLAFQGGGRLTFRHKNFGHSSRLQSILLFHPTINIDLDELDSFSNTIAETVLIANTIREIGVRVQLFHVIGNVPGNGRWVHPVIW